MGKADRATPSKKRVRAVIDPALPAGKREHLRDVLDAIDRYRAHRAKEPPDRYRQDGDDLPFRHHYPSALEDLLTSRNAWGRAVLGVGGLVVFMVAHRTLNPFGIWLTPDMTGAAVLLGWLHDAAAVAVMLSLLSVAVQLAWAIRKESRGPWVSQDEELYWASQDRFIGPDELDAPARKLLARSQRAIQTVLSSTINEVGLLDRIHNEMLLPSVEWEIAKRLRYSTQLRRDHPDFVEAGAPQGSAHAAFMQAERVIAGRVEALERYAERTLAADIAYQGAAGDDEYVTVALEGLTDQADTASRTFRRSLDQVHEVAAELTQNSRANNEL